MSFNLINLYIYLFYVSLSAKRKKKKAPSDEAKKDTNKGKQARSKSSKSSNKQLKLSTVMTSAGQLTLAMSAPSASLSGDVSKGKNPKIKSRKCKTYCEPAVVVNLDDSDDHANTVTQGSERLLKISLPDLSFEDNCYNSQGTDSAVSASKPSFLEFEDITGTSSCEENDLSLIIERFIKKKPVLKKDTNMLQQENLQLKNTNYENIENPPQSLFERAQNIRSKLTSSSEKLAAIDKKYFSASVANRPKDVSSETAEIYQTDDTHDGSFFQVTEKTDDINSVESSAFVAKLTSLGNDNHSDLSAETDLCKEMLSACIVSSDAGNVSLTGSTASPKVFNTSNDMFAESDCSINESLNYNSKSMSKNSIEKFVSKNDTTTIHGKSTPKRHLYCSKDTGPPSTSPSIGSAAEKPCFKLFDSGWLDSDSLLSSPVLSEVSQEQSAPSEVCSVNNRDESTSKMLTFGHKLYSKNRSNCQTPEISSHHSSLYAPITPVGSKHRHSSQLVSSSPYAENINPTQLFHTSDKMKKCIELYSTYDQENTFASSPTLRTTSLQSSQSRISVDTLSNERVVAITQSPGTITQSPNTTTQSPDIITQSPVTITQSPVTITQSPFASPSVSFSPLIEQTSLADRMKKRFGKSKVSALLLN